MSKEKEKKDKKEKKNKKDKKGVSKFSCGIAERKMNVLPDRTKKKGVNLTMTLLKACIHATCETCIFELI